MGNYLNPDNSKFQEALNSDIYVDKTGLIRYTNSVLHTYRRTYVSADQDVSESLWLQIC